MRKLSILLVAVFMGGVIFAQNDKVIEQKLSKEEVIKFINETNVIIKKTSELVKVEKNYTGGVVKGVEFQKEAIVLFKKGKLQESINKSFMARKLVFVAHRANSDKPVPKAWRLTEPEKEIISVTFSKEKTDLLLTKEIIGKEKKEVGTLTKEIFDVK